VYSVKFFFKALILIFCLLYPSLSVKGGVFGAPPITKVVLKNGMKFLIVPRGDTPVFSALIAFRVGGIEEDEGQTGLAHMFEHMAFKGTRGLGTKNYAMEIPLMEALDHLADELNQEYDKKDLADPQKILEIRKKMGEISQQQQKYTKSGEITQKMLEHGGTGYNATTSKDTTQYFVSLPSDQLMFWAQLESQRIFKPILREFYQERDIVMEERRMRVDDSPEGQLYEKLLQYAFQKSPYRWPTIGHAEDIRRFTRKEATNFLKRYYCPANAVGVLVGRLDVTQTRSLLDKTFGTIPSPCPVKTKTSQPHLSLEPPQKNRIDLSLHAEPSLMMAFSKPTLPHDDDYVFDVIDEILSGGKTSKLYRRLIKEKKVASSVSTYTSIPGARLPHLFLIQASPYGNKNIQSAEDEIWKTLERLKKEPITEEALKKARHNILSDMIWHIKTNEGLANMLAYYEILLSDWKYLENYPSHLEKVTAEDIQRVARDYFTRDNNITAVLRKK